MIVYNDTYCVYAHINMTNGKIYIGQTKRGYNPNKRWNNGDGYKDNEHFYRAIQKYGWDNFDHEIIASNLTVDEANHFEELLIKELDTMNPEKGYNLRSGGENNIPSEQTRKKQSESAKKRFENPDERERYSISAKKKFENIEERQKISRGRKGKMCGENHPNYGKDPSKKAIEKRKQTTSTEEYRKKMSEKNSRANNPHARKFNQYDKHMNFIQTWECGKDAEISLGILASNISRCAQGVRPTAGGFLWFYADDPDQPDKSKIIPNNTKLIKEVS